MLRGVPEEKQQIELTMHIRGHFALALALRAAFIALGYLQDSLSELKYTDIDYKVFTDAALHLADGRSPYQRPTYRYTPILACLLLPNVLLHDAFGKVLFCLFDVFTSLLILSIQAKAGLEPATCRASTLLWLYNPLPLVISSRGSAESLVTFLVVLCVRLSSFPILLGLVFGLAVHFKIYPCIYALSLYLSLAPSSPSSQLPSRTLPSFRQHPSTTLGSSLSYQLPSSRLSSSSSSQLTSRTLQSSSFSQIPSRTQSSSATPLQLFSRTLSNLWLLLRPSKPRFLFVASSALGFLIPTLVSLHIYGDEYFRESFLYHLTRKDIRHNFSPFFYPLYLLESHPNPKLSAVISSNGFLIQGSLVALASLTLPSHLPSCMLVQTTLFVSFNKVCTSQYFAWYLCFLPLSCHIVKDNWKGVVGALVVWGGGQAMWLAAAYWLEFEGKNAFFLVFVATLALFLINVYLVCLFIRCVKKKKKNEIKID